MIVPAAILLVLYGGLALIAWRSPLLGRLALREAVRRPAHTLRTIGPAVRASRMRASEALRIVG